MNTIRGIQTGEGTHVPGQPKNINNNSGLWRNAKRPVVIATMALTALSGASAQSTADQTRFVPFSEFVQGIQSTAASDVMTLQGAKVTSSAAVEEMRQHLIRLYGGVNVSHSFVLSGQTVDCVPIHEQPGVRALRLTTIATPPAEVNAPTALEANNVKALSPDAQIPEGESTDASGNSLTCETGTVPIRRVTLEQMSRFGSLHDFFEKGPNGAGHARIPGKFAPPQTDAHKYSITFQYVNNWGDNADINLWRPPIYQDIGEVFSLAQSWTIGTGTTTQTAEVGWQNYPARVGTSSSVPFIYYTADDYNTTGCYDLTCGAFVQVNKALTFGIPFKAASYSVPHGAQYELDFTWEFSGGNWWLRYGSTWLGYYPGSVYRGGQLTKFSNLLEFGSESVGSTVWPAEGSGLWSSNGWTYAAYQRELYYIAPNTSYTTYWDTLTKDQSSPACYTVTGTSFASNWGVYFWFGGPGGAGCQ